jgi:phosphatidylinositol alpha-mannosyltransferase
MAAAARERAERFAWPHVAAEVLDSYEHARVLGASAARKAGTRLEEAAVRYGFAPADRLPRIPAQRLPSLEPSRPRAAGRGSGVRRLRLLRALALSVSCLAGLVLALLALGQIGVQQVAASLLASRPGLVAAGLGLMCAAMVARALSWHAILVAAPTWRRPNRRDAMQGTFIGVLMSATQPARLGEPSRALIVARRLGRAHETLPIVLGTMVSQTLLNLLALGILGGLTLSSVSVLDGHGDNALLLVALAPLAALLAVALAPALIPALGRSSSARIGQRSPRLQMLMSTAGRTLLRLRDGLRVFRQPRNALAATVAQLGAWALQWMSCWLLLMAFGLDSQVGVGGAAAVLFAVNVTAVVPATPANVGVFQAACVAVLAGAYHVSTPDAIAYGIVLQAVEVAAAVLMGVPALLNEGLSWKEVRLRTIHATPVRLSALPEPQRGVAQSERLGG